MLNESVSGGSNSHAARRTGRRRAIGPLVIASLATLLGSCSKGSDKNAYVPPPPPEVIVANPVERDVVSYLRYTGTIEASESVDLRARVQGFLEKVNFQPGQRVKKGELLFVIDKRQFQNELDQARAAMAAAQAAHKGAENDARLARELADQKAGPEIDAIIKAARRDVAEAEIERARARVADAELNLSYCEITAPIDGRVTRNLVDVGNLVGRGEPTLLATIVQSTPAYVSVDVSESDVLAVRRELEKAGQLGKNEPGQIGPGKWRPCELALTGQAEYKFPGRVDYVEPQLNQQTGTLRVRTVYENTDEALLAGYFAAIRFPMSSESSLLVPEAALLTDQQGRYALIVNDENKVEVRRVTLGTLDGDTRVVSEGLEPDDRVIVLGVLKARPGSVVTPKMQAAETKATKGAEKSKKPAKSKKTSADRASEPGAK